MRRMSGPLWPLFAGLAGWLLLRRSVDVVEVRGHSMSPALLPGDRLVAVRARRPPHPGEVVLALDPRDVSRELVKRVATVDAAGVELRGDDPRHSTDSLAFGRLPLSAVRWRVLGRYWPPERAGTIGSPPSADPGESD